MQPIQPYLLFNGNCREAMEFYARALDAKLNFTTYAEAPQLPPVGADLIMHAHLAAGSLVLMASDAPPGQSVPMGHNFNLFLACDSQEQEETLFAALGEGGQVRQPLQDTSWEAHFGMLQDRFGVGWMLSYHMPQP